jgi:hypothetical protein
MKFHIPVFGTWSWFTVSSEYMYLYSPSQVWMKMDSPSLSHENQGYHIQNTHGIGRIAPPLSNSCCLAKGRKELHEVGLRQRRCFNSLSDSKIQVN